MDFDQQLVQLYPYLRRLAVSLLGRAEGADDLVQDTMLRATAGAHLFEPGTNMKAWTTVILRNIFLSEKRKDRLRRRFILSMGEKTPDVEVDAREQFARLAFKEAMAYMETLSPEHRDVINVLAIEGVPYKDAAKRIGIAEGTVKSRMNRARENMRDHLPEYD